MLVFLWSNDLVFNIETVLTFLVFFGKLAVGAIGAEGGVCAALKSRSFGHLNNI